MSPIGLKKKIEADSATHQNLPHRHHGVEIRPDHFLVSGEQVRFGRRQSQFLHQSFHLLENLVQFVRLINIRHVPRVQYVVQILEKRLGFDLRVGKKKNSFAFLKAGFEHQRLDVFAPVEHSVTFVYFDLEAEILRHEGRQSCEALSPCRTFA
jgi:hypothetical protein